jgi:hypothetical protein
MKKKKSPQKAHRRIRQTGPDIIHKSRRKAHPYPAERSRRITLEKRSKSKIDHNNLQRRVKQ